ncbi:Uncharacterised protein [Serratia fonticola]|uniref:Uncharacterized protein n=1 Tax=Serratia fonticola TaxID=47917 RepID=A0A4U9W407_SERFO|nr:Uncharacterised protein [Serratia fonticola]
MWWQSRRASLNPVRKAQAAAQQETGKAKRKGAAGQDQNADDECLVTHYFSRFLISKPNSENSTGMPIGTKGTLARAIRVPEQAEMLVRSFFSEPNNQGQQNGGEHGVQPDGIDIGNKATDGATNQHAQRPAGGDPQPTEPVGLPVFWPTSVGKCRTPRFRRS